MRVWMKVARNYIQYMRGKGYQLGKEIRKGSCNELGQKGCNKISQELCKIVLNNFNKELIKQLCKKNYKEAGKKMQRMQQGTRLENMQDCQQVTRQMKAFLHSRL